MSEALRMHEVKAGGSYRDIGLTTGRMLRKDAGLIPKFSKENIERGMAFEREVRKYAPELLEELQGIAEGSGVDYDVLAAFELSPYRLQPSCLVMAVSGQHTRSGLPVLAHNQEYTEESAEDLTVCYTQPKGKKGSLGFTYHMMNMTRFGGVNEARLAIASVSGSFDNSGPGVMFNVAQRWILDNCGTVEEAVRFLRKIPHTWGTVYLMIDQSNTIAKVEAHRTATKVAFADEGFEVVTLRFDSPELDQYDEKGTDHARWISEAWSARKRFLSQWFDDNKGHIGNETIISALKSHEHKLCTHDCDGHVHWGTAWSWILWPGGGKAAVCAGPPCRNEFKEIPQQAL